MSTGEFWLAIIAVGYSVYRMADAWLPPFISEHASADAPMNQVAHVSVDDEYRFARSLRAHDNDDDRYMNGGVNIDGTPMMDDFLDVHGNAFGMTDDWKSNDWSS